MVSFNAVEFKLTHLEARYFINDVMHWWIQQYEDRLAIPLDLELQKILREHLTTYTGERVARQLRRHSRVRPFGPQLECIPGEVEERTLELTARQAEWVILVFDYWGFEQGHTTMSRYLQRRLREALMAYL